MTEELHMLEAPRVTPPLDDAFRPLVLSLRRFHEEVAAAGCGVPLVLGLERADGTVSRFELNVFPQGHPQAPSNEPVVERLTKLLLWQKGAWRIYVGGAPAIAAALARAYAPNGPRGFDARLMGDVIYGRAFEVVSCAVAEVPPEREASRLLGRHLEGCRIGFDLGASDRKVSAVIDGQAVFSEEVPWNPRDHADPGYHHNEILAALRRAAEHLPRVDAIGGSAAGVYVDNQVRVASLFRGVPPERFDEVRSLFLRIREELSVPLEVVNDGEVTALAGSMSLGDDGVLGLALGSSLAAGYVNLEGAITSWLNELAFAPLDLAPTAPVDEWSGDRGVGASYLSQQCVFRLAPLVGIPVRGELSLAERLEQVQARLEAADEGARQIWETMGVYLGYAIALYEELYDLKHVLVLGRCTSGAGGPILLEQAQRVLRAEAAGGAVTLHLPDERTRRVGQAIAAASLPAIEGRS